MIIKIILTDSPEDRDRKFNEKLITTKDPVAFIRIIEALR
jgi:hypothetical protein